jgi:phenylacetic acid degradation operon negative regulatory protein
MEQTLETIELVTRPSNSTQFYIFNLFADYVLPRGGRIWANDLLCLLELLGVNQGAARTTLSRMKQQGWFETTKDGRESQYAISERGRAILAEGDQRIFEEPVREWDGRWHLIVYSLPEEQRKLRNEFRKKLLWFGFGNLAPGTWVSAHDRQMELTAVQNNLGIGEFVTMFTAVTADNDHIVQNCWDIPALAADYAQFVQRHQPAYEAFRDGWLTPPPADCFVRRFWLTYNFQRFPLKDPNLPAPLLPADWIGYTARQIFNDYRRLLEEGIGSFMDDIVRSM